jgi:hypothetical protein
LYLTPNREKSKMERSYHVHTLLAEPPAARRTLQCSQYGTAASVFTEHGIDKAPAGDKAQET